MGEIVRITGALWVIVGELRCYGLSQEHAASLPQKGHAGSVGFWSMFAVDWRIVFCRHVGGVDNVLDADGDAVQQAARPLSVDRSRLFDGIFGIEKGPCVHSVLARGDPIETRDDQCLAREFAARDPTRGFNCAEFVRLLRHGFLVELRLDLGSKYRGDVCPPQLSDECIRWF
jgi:hypothetical protein